MMSARRGTTSPGSRPGGNRAWIDPIATRDRGFSPESLVESGPSLAQADFSVVARPASMID